MPPNEDLNDWLGNLSWQGYPRLSPIRDAASAADRAPEVPRARRADELEALKREKESLRAEAEALRSRVMTLKSLASDFERSLSDAASSYEDAALEADAARRGLELENARLAGELESARAELRRRESRDHVREADLALERERRADCEKALVEARRRLNDCEADLADTRAKGAELSGSIGELRRQAAASHERLLQAKVLTDQDVQLLRAEMREFLAKFHRIQETFGESDQT